MHSATGQSQPGSLPRDYAILSRFSASNAKEPDETNEPLVEDSDVADGHSPSRQGAFIRSHFTAPHSPSNPAGSSNILAGASETTPLLPPLIPRIEESVDHSPNEHDRSTFSIFLEELGILSKYTLPVFGTHVFEHSLILASVVSIGHLSTVALAASTLGFMTANVTGLSIIQGLASALDTLLPAAWTSDRPQLVGLWTQRMVVVTGVTLIPITVIWFNAESILLLLRQDAEVARLAALYLKWESLGLPAYAFNCISRRYFQSQGLFAVPTRIIMAIAPINILMTYLLVWGPESIRLGFIGAPIASSISYNLVSIASIAYGVFFVEKTAWHPISRRSFTSLGLLVHLGLAGVGQVASEWWSWELVGLAASLLGPVALATQSVLLASASSTYQAPFALSVAASVRVGNLLGERNARRAGISANTSIVLGIAIAAFFSTVLLSFRKSWGHLFNDDPEVVSLVASILPWVALFQVFDATCGVSGGILRARGKQTTGALINLSAYYIIGIPFGIWLTFSQDMKLAGLWIGLTVSLIYGSSVGIYLCWKADWAKEVEKTSARLAIDKKTEPESHLTN